MFLSWLVSSLFVTYSRATYVYVYIHTAVICLIRRKDSDDARPEIRNQGIYIFVREGWLAEDCQELRFVYTDLFYYGVIN